MTKSYEYTVTMNDGTVRKMTVNQMVEEWGLGYRLLQKRVSSSGWRTEKLLRMTPAQGQRHTTDRFRKVLAGERYSRAQQEKKSEHS